MSIYSNLKDNMGFRESTSPAIPVLRNPYYIFLSVINNMKKNH